MATGSFYAQVQINQPGNLVSCDSNNDGSETFDLTVTTQEILGGLSVSDYSVDFYQSMTGAETEDDSSLISSPANYMVPIGSFTIYVRVEEIADPDNFAFTSFQITGASLPVFSIGDVTICEGEIVLLDSGLNGEQYLFQWYFDTSLIGGANTSTLVVTSAGLYSLTVEDVATGCFTEESATVTINPSAVATLSGTNLIEAGETAFVSITGTPGATVIYTIDNNGIVIQEQSVLDSNGNVTFSISNITLSATVCLVEASTNSIPSCTSVLTDCMTIVLNSDEIVNIPDANFKAKLIALGIDANSDGQIQYTEASLITGTLNVSVSNIADLTGLEAFVNITGLYCAGNNLTQVDVSHIQGDDFDFSGNPDLQYINMKNGINNSCTVLLGDCCDYICAMFLDLPSLQFICIDENEATTDLMWTIPEEININSYCSFDLGGNYNTITGIVGYGFNNNGCGDDLGQPLIKLSMDDGTGQVSSFTNATGNYIFYIQEGDFTITPQLENPSLFTVSPVDATINFPTNDNLVSIQNFCISANGVQPNAEIVVAPVTPARPGFDAEYKIVYKNTGNQSLWGQVYFNYDDTVLDFVNADNMPASQSAGLLTWDFMNLHPFESQSINVILNVNGPMEVPAVNIDDVLIFNAGINPVEGNETVFSYSQTVVGSFDPNDIICLQGSNAAPSEIGSYLHYMINFENTGTAPAENVVVRVDIDATKYDISSLQILNGSHPFEARVSNNIAEFIFKNINLETNGHGNILLKVKSKSSLNTGDTVTKRANIFFDYNFPIETNNASTTFQDLAVGEHLIDGSITIYPNPSHGLVNIEANSIINSIQVYDLQGRLLMTYLVSDTNATIDISNKANGLYFFKVNSDKGIKVEKVIKK